MRPESTGSLPAAPQRCPRARPDVGTAAPSHHRHDAGAVHPPRRNHAFSCVPRPRPVSSHPENRCAAPRAPRGFDITVEVYNRVVRGVRDGGPFSTDCDQARRFHVGREARRGRPDSTGRLILVEWRVEVPGGLVKPWKKFTCQPHVRSRCLAETRTVSVLPQLARGRGEDVIQRAGSPDSDRRRARRQAGWPRRSARSVALRRARARKRTAAARPREITLTHT